jgi:hypothetical protein
VGEQVGRREEKGEGEEKEERETRRVLKQW